MGLSKIGLLAVRGCKGIVPKLAGALKVTTPTVYSYLQANSDNLTKAAALKIIKSETGLSDEEILEAEPENEGQAQKHSTSF